MTPPRNAYKRQRQQARTARREAKRRAITQATTKRQRTRAHTPVLWRNRVKGFAVKANLKKREWKRFVRQLPRWTTDDKQAA